MKTLTPEETARLTDIEADKWNADKPAKCHTRICESAPAVRVFWPGRTRDFCAPCAERAKHVAAAMGFEVTVALLVAS